MGLRFLDYPSQLFQGRDTPPAHYMLKTNSFSQIAKSQISKYSSNEFEVGDYTWKLNIYPNGNKEEGGDGHISLNIEMVGTSSLPIGWAVNAIIKLFVCDQIEDRYYTIPDYKLVLRFGALRKEWGVSRFMDVEVFNDSSNGYSVNDSCVFGAEVFIIPPLNKIDELFVLKNGVNFTISPPWKIKSFSKSVPNSNYKESPPFTWVDLKWRIKVYPYGHLEGKGDNVSIYLHLDVWTLPSYINVTVAYKLRITNEDKSNVYEMEGNGCFTPVVSSCGFRRFMSLAELRDDKLGILVDDTLFVEAEIAIIGVITTH